MPNRLQVVSSVRVEAARKPWAHDQMAENFRDGRNVWVEVSQDFYDHALNVLPPIMFDGSRFLLGEPYTDSRDGTVYAGFVALDGRYFARYVALPLFIGAVLELSRNLPPVADA